MPKLDQFSHETIWFLVTAAATGGLAYITTSAQPTDVKTWLFALGVAMARPVFGLLANAVPSKPTS